VALSQLACAPGCLAYLFINECYVCGTRLPSSAVCEI